jgi:hypothetical protein
MLFYRETSSEIGEMAGDLLAEARAELEQGSRFPEFFCRERKCSAAIHAGYGTLACPRACARETRSDQEQAAEIPRFKVRKAGDYRARSDRQRFPASMVLRANGACVSVRYMF